MNNVILKGIGNALSGIGAKAIVLGKKKSPEILAVAGVAAVVGAVALVIKESRTGNDICDAAKEDRESIKEAMEDETSGVSEEEGTKMIAKSYMKQSLGLAKTYGPAMTLGVAGLVCLLASNNIVKQRNANLVLAYNALEKGFEGYRNRVKEQFGEEVEEMIHYDLKKEKREEEVVDEATGKKKKVKKDVMVSEGEHNTGSAYDCLFCEYTNPNWRENHWYNLRWLIGQRNSAQWEIDRKAGATLYLTDVLRTLGYELTKEQHKKLAGYGWEYGDKVDFGIREEASEATRRFIEGLEVECLLLSFNAKRLY